MPAEKSLMYLHWDSQSSAFKGLCVNLTTQMSRAFNFYVVSRPHMHPKWSPVMFYKISFPTRLAPSLGSWRIKSENRSALALGVDLSVLWFPRTWILQVIPLFIFALMRNHRIAENRAAVPQKLRFNISAKEVMNKPFLMNSNKLELWCLNHISTMEKERDWTTEFK